MALLPARNILDGTALPVTSQMKTALGSLRDYCSDLLGTDSSNKAAARTALGAAASGANTDITSLGSVASINGGQLAGMRNLLINGNLSINQRGYVSGTATSGANQYTLDRWRVVTSGQSLAFTASGNGNSMTAPAGGVEQVIEGANIGGGTYVLGWTGTATATVNGTARTKGESFTLAANTNATVRLIGGTASLVQLEPGGTVTPFEHRPYGMELALCQRYLPAVISNNVLNTFAVGQVINTASALLGVAFPVTARVAPTGVTISSLTHIAVRNSAGAQVLVSTSATLANASNSCCEVYLQGASGLTAGMATIGYLTNANAYILFTGCEL